MTVNTGAFFPHLRVAVKRPVEVSTFLFCEALASNNVLVVVLEYAARSIQEVVYVLHCAYVCDI